MAGSEAEHVKFLLSIIKSCADFRADYHVIAAEHRLASANSAQKRFKAIVEKYGMGLVNGKVVSGTPGAAGPAGPAGPATPKKRPKAEQKILSPARVEKKQRASRKGRVTARIQDKDDEDDEDAGMDVDESNGDEDEV